MNPVHTIPSYFSKIHCNIILPHSLVLPSGLFSSGLPARTIYAYNFFPFHATCPADLILLDLIILMGSDDGV
jgi:hypothetical protein